MAIRHEFSVDVEPAPAGVVVRVSGPIDLASLPSLETALLDAVLDVRGSVKLDLRQTTFLDSAGIAVLVRTLRRCRTNRTQFCVCLTEGGGVHRVLQISGIAGALPLCDDC